MIASDKFRELAEQTAEQSGLVDARIASVEHPVGGALESELVARAESITDDVINLLSGRGK